MRFDSIRILESNGIALPFLGEQPETWDLTLFANDRSLTLPIQARDSIDLPINREFDVGLPSPSSTLSIRASGLARAAVRFFDQPLPAADNMHGAADNWGLASQLQLRASDRNRAYTVFYSVRCLTGRVTSLIAHSQAISITRAALAPLLNTRDLPDDIALTLFIRQMEAHGHRLREVQSEHLVWEGARDIRSTLSRLRPPAEGNAPNAGHK